jgi:hypothetical protein
MSSHPDPTQRPRAARRPSRARLVALLVAFAACDANAFDDSQVPTITLAPVVSLPTFTVSWTPSGAQSVRVYRGATAGDGYTESLWWSVVATGKNTIVSGLEYASTLPVGGTTDVRGKPLVPGETYTVQVTRADPKGTGDGFTNTSNRYISTRTYVVPSSIPSP